MSSFKSIYEQARQLIIWLGLVELAWFAWWLLQPGGQPTEFVGLVIGWLVTMLAWMTLVVYAGTNELFLRHTMRFSNLVGFAFVVTLAIAFFASSEISRDGITRAAMTADEDSLVAIHILRLLAIGTVIKYWQGELPRHFVIWGSLPDVLFAISAMFATLFVAGGRVDAGFLIGWHTIGSLVFLGPGISMFFSVPSAIQIYRDSIPDTSLVFRYPMLLAPNFTVPLFTLAHGLALVKLLA